MFISAAHAHEALRDLRLQGFIEPLWCFVRCITSHANQGTLMRQNVHQCRSCTRSAQRPETPGIHRASLVLCPLHHFPCKLRDTHETECSSVLLMQTSIRSASYIALIDIPFLSAAACHWHCMAGQFCLLLANRCALRPITFVPSVKKRPNDVLMVRPLLS
jgi:hypothetical protein